MPLLPRDHRDELVAGALVGAVVIVLGYASGIGAPSASGQAATSPTPPPVATAPPIPMPTAPAGSGAQAPGTGAGQPPVGAGELPGYGGIGADTGYGTGGQAGGTAGTGEAGHGGHQTAPPAGNTGSPAPTPTPSPSGSTPADSDTCEDGEVTLVRPLLGELTQPVFGLLDGTDETPEPQPSPCVGLAPLSLTGLLGAGASPQPEATP